MKIAICIAHSYPNFDKKFVFSLLLLLEGFHIWNKDKNHEIKLFINSEGFTGIAHMREKLAEQAIEEGYEYLMWLDTDMDFPPGIIPKMIAWFEEHPNLEAVSGLYQWKESPFLPHIYSFDKKDSKFIGIAAFPLKKAFPVDGVGYGCVMIKSSVYARIDKPWFEFKSEEYGEDMFFFAKAQPINMICDPRIACSHFLQNEINVGDYLDYNGLSVDEEGMIEINKEQLEKIDGEHSKKNTSGPIEEKKKSLPKKLIDKLKK